MTRLGAARNALAAGDCADYEQRLAALSEWAGEFGIDRLVRPVLLADEEAEEGAPLTGGVVANGTAQGGMFCFERVKDAPDGDGSGDLQRDLVTEAGEHTQMLRA